MLKKVPLSTQPKFSAYAIIWEYVYSLFSKKYFISLFLERGKGERERNINVWLPLTHPPTGDLACNPGVCPNQESNQLPFGLQASAQSTELQQPGLFIALLKIDYCLTR